jgi:hypothetical protein
MIETQSMIRKCEDRVELVLERTGLVVEET